MADKSEPGEIAAAHNKKYTAPLSRSSLSLLQLSRIWQSAPNPKTGGAAHQRKEKLIPKSDTDFDLCGQKITQLATLIANSKSLRGSIRGFTRRNLKVLR
jgi:hypothetical protein